MPFTKRVLEGTAVLTLANLVGRLLSFITVPIVSHSLGPEPYGAAGLVGTVTSIAVTLALLGIDMGYARFAWGSAAEHRIAVERYCWRFAVCGALAAGLISWLGWYFWGDRWLASHMEIAFYSAAAILLSVLSTMATTRARLMGNYRRIAFASIVAALASATFVVVSATYWRSDVWVLLGGITLSWVVSLLLVGSCQAELFKRPIGLPREMQRQVVMLGLAGSVTAPMYWLISSMDRWFIAEYVGVAEVGVYSMAANIAALGLIINSSLVLTWFPETSRLYAEKGEVAHTPIGVMFSRLTVGLSSVWLAITAAGGDLLRLLAAPEFHGGARFIPWLAGGVFFYGLSSLATTSSFLKGKMRHSAYVWLMGGLICLVANWLMVEPFGGVGAAMAQCISYGFIALAMSVISRTVMPLTVRWGQLTLALITVLAVGISMAPGWSNHPLVSLACKAPVYGIVAVSLLFLFAPSWLVGVWRILIQKLSHSG